MVETVLCRINAILQVGVVQRGEKQGFARFRGKAARWGPHRVLPRCGSRDFPLRTVPSRIASSRIASSCARLS